MGAPPPDTPSGPPQGFGTLAFLATTERARRLLRGAVITSMVWSVSRDLYRKARQRMAYTVTIDQSDSVYDDVHAWLVAKLPARRLRSLTARTGRGRRRRPDEPVPIDDDAPPPPEVFLRYNGARVMGVTIGGHRCRVEVERDASTIRIGGENFDVGNERERIVFTASTEAGRDAVLDFLREMAMLGEEQVRHRFYMATRWGDWRRLSDLPTRDLATVVLRDGLREALVEDLTEFLDAEESYARLGIPWHRGYVFHGPPGTGKTSLAKALAQHFRLDVRYVALSDLTADTNLLGMLGSIESRSMLVLEDVDVVHAAKDRDDGQAQVITTSGLLNALDGFATPHGLITVMTTNRLEVLDGALLRPGRADRIEELGFLDNEQARRIMELVTGQTFPEGDGPPIDVGDHEFTAADLVEAAKPHLDDPLAAELAMRGLLNAGVHR